MDNVSAEENEKGKNGFITVLLTGFVLCAIVAGALTNYKQETLVCTKSKDICYIQKINLLNMKFNRKLVKYSDIAEVGYMREKVKGNRYAKGYSSYLLTFNLKDNNRKVIFSKAYFEREELNSVIRDLTNQILSPDDEIKLNRN